MRLRFLVLLAATVLGACNAPVLPPDEVLRRTFFQSSSLDTYSYTAQGAVSLRGRDVFSGSLLLEGAVKRGGAWSANAASDIERVSNQTIGRLDGILHLRSPGNGILYIKTTGIAGEEGDHITRALAPVTTDGWTRFAFPVSRNRAGMTMPTQEMIDAQVSALRVTADRTDPEEDYYEYDVELSDESLSLLGSEVRSGALTGTLWIDRRTFVLTRAHWTASALMTPAGTLSFVMDVSFSLQNETLLPSMPLGTGATLPLNTIFDIISADVPLSS